MDEIEGLEFAIPGKRTKSFCPLNIIIICSSDGTGTAVYMLEFIQITAV